MPSLPQPAPSALARSNKLRDIIQQTINTKDNGMCFSDYMHMALYTPELGYYNSPTISFGKSGDFVTAPEISDLFSKVTARQIASVIKKIKNPCIVEFGAGSGRLAAFILSEFDKMGINIDKYLILETSKHLQNLQNETLANCYPGYSAKVKWINKLPQKTNGVVLANEVMDAMPVKRFVIEHQKIYEILVTDSFNWRKGKEIVLDLPYHLSEYPDGYISEYSELVVPWVNTVLQSLHQGLVLLIDYGYEDFEYYHPARKTGTLKCFYRHHQHEDPFLFPGLCDISAHINFSQIAKLVDAYIFVSQAEFLLYGGITELVEDSASIVKRAKISKEIQTLVRPEQMGEVVKVLGLCKNIEPPDFQLVSIK